MTAFCKTSFNPNPVTKLFVVFATGLTVVHSINIKFELAIVFIISLLFYLNGYKKTLLKWLTLGAILFSLPNFMTFSNLNYLLKMFLSIPIVIRMFILPFMAASFMIKTSDVGTILSSMDKLKVSKNFSIPLAVMFRYFPSFRQEKKNIKMAMKIRGIGFKNPFKYFEYVTVPLLIISSNLADDIAKAAETKAIESPLKKTRYFPAKIRPVDFVYLISILALVIGGRSW